MTSINKTILPIITSKMLARLTLCSLACLFCMICGGLPTAFAKTTEQHAALSIYGSGAQRGSIIMIFTGSDNLQTTVDKNGNFSFNNMPYASSRALSFVLQIPESTGEIKTPAATLKMTYKPQGSRLIVTGNIGKASGMSILVSGADPSPLHIAGIGGDISFSARSNIPMSSGLSQMKARLTRVAELCCPKILVPTKPIDFVIASVPVKGPPLQNKTIKYLPNTIVAPRGEPETTSPTAPAYIVPPKNNPADVAPSKEKNIIPYIIQGSLTTAPITVTTGTQNYGISFSQADYDATWDGGYNALLVQLRNAIAVNTTAFMSFIDVTNLLTSLRTINNQRTNTAKDYAPSEQICRFGTLSRSLALTQNDAERNKLAFEKIMNDLNARRVGTLFEDQQVGVVTRMHEFQKKYCSEADNNNFLEDYCNVTATPDLTIDRDVDFTRVFDTPLTLDVNLATASGTPTATSLVALFRNMTYLSPYDNVNTQNKNQPEMISIDLARSLNASRSVANNSFAALVGEKVKGSAASTVYMKEALKKLGLTAAGAKNLIGDNPSYFAQMEVMTKKIFQDPAFFANLYESPANIDRQSVAMAAIALQQDRDFLESLRRKEMLLSTLLSLKLKPAAADANASGVASTSGPR